MICFSAKPSHNSLKLRPFIAVLLAGFSLFAPQFSAAADPTNPDNSPLPDLGNPTQQGSASIRPGPGGIALESTFDQQKILVSPEYSDQTGLGLGVGFASMLGENVAIGVLLNVGSDKREYLLNAGFKFDERQRVIVTAGQLKQFLDYAFLSGTEKVGMTQNSAALSYQLQLGTEFLRFLEVNGYVAKTASRDLTDKTFAVDSDTFYELWNDPRRIAGGKVAGLQGRLGFSPIEGSAVKVSLGQERLSYDLLVGKDSVNRLTGGVEWLQQLPNHYNLKLAADTFASQNRYSAGIERSLAGANGGRHSMGLNLVDVRGRDGLGNDNQVQLTYSYSFGTSATAQGRSGFDPAMTKIAANGATGQSTVPFGSRLLDQVAQRPSVIPSHVVAKIDQTALPTRLIAVDKTTLPASSTLDAATGDITTPLGIAVTGIASITRNGSAFANTTQFVLSGNSLITRPSQIVQPAVGVVDTYVVTINNSGGGTTLATVLVSHGSVKIDSIVVTQVGPNHNPNTLSAISPVAVAVGATGSVVLPSTTDSDGDTLAYSIVGALPTGFSFNPATRLLSWSGATPAGNYNFLYKADDGKGGSVTASVAVNAVLPTLPASLSAIGPLADAGGVLPVSFSINMPTLHDTSGNQISYTVTGLPTTDGSGEPVTWSLIQSGATISVSSVYVEGGTSNHITTLTLNVSSSGALGSTSVQVAIRAN